MSFEFDGRQIETTASGYLVDPDDWSVDLAAALAGAEGIDLTERHWELLRYLREAYFENRESQPNTRAIVKAMSAAWGEKVSQKDVYELFPLDPSKQGGRIAGLPESKRKGGY